MAMIASNNTKTIIRTNSNDRNQQDDHPQQG
jgi:hypothetical protein